MRTFNVTAYWIVLSFQAINIKPRLTVNPPHVLGELIVYSRKGWLDNRAGMFKNRDPQTIMVHNL